MISIIFDSETTGLLLPSVVPVEKQPRIIEIACVVCEGAEILHQYVQLVDPEMRLPPIITKITGLKDADLVGAPKWREVATHIATYFAMAQRAVAHNLDFDYHMINNEMRRMDPAAVFPWPKGLVCTIQAYIHLKGKWLKQGALYEHFMKKPQAKSHRAMDDVLALHECLVAAKFFEEPPV